jgi:hypothetical protein
MEVVHAPPVVGVADNLMPDTGVFVQPDGTVFEVDLKEQQSQPREKQSKCRLI